MNGARCASRASSSGATDANGIVDLPVPADDQRGRRFLYARLGRDLALDLDAPYWTASEPPDQTTASLVFTDRSIYRPQQKVLWKVLAYRGNPREGRFAVYPRASVTVNLIDQNNQTVESRAVTTNEFGTAAGEFSIPSGRALGAWRVDTSLSGSASVRVEEYKRPTFEVTLKDPAEPLRLNRPARLTGEARYYFGLPVASGKVRVARRADAVVSRLVLVARLGRASPDRDGRHGRIRAAGGRHLHARLHAQGGRAPVRQRGPPRRHVLVLDPRRCFRTRAARPGRTRATFRLGFIAVKRESSCRAGSCATAGQGVDHAPADDLDGVPRAGAGSWRIVAPGPAGGDGSAGGSATRRAFGAQSGRRLPHCPAMRSARAGRPSTPRSASWPRGRRAARSARGDVTHDEKGRASVAGARASRRSLSPASIPRATSSGRSSRCRAISWSRAAEVDAAGARGGACGRAAVGPVGGTARTAGDLGHSRASAPLRDRPGRPAHRAAHARRRGLAGRHRDPDRGEAPRRIRREAHDGARITSSSCRPGRSSCPGTTRS